MQKDYIDRIIKLIPDPILKNLNINIDKDYIYSRGDYLYSLSTNAPIMAGFRVTSHVADGLCTFGYWYFIIQFILFYIQFKLLDCFVYYKRHRVMYSICGLIFTYQFIGQFRNSQGCFGEIGFIIRGWIQIIFLYFIILILTKTITKFK